MNDFISLNYKNILLKHGKCVVNSRNECDISTTFANKKITSPVFCSNMVSILNKDIIKEFDDNKWFHIWHRIGDYNHIKEYIKWANENNLYFVSISIGVKDKDVDLLNWIKSSGYRVNSICIDVAFSYSDAVSKMIDKIKSDFNSYLIVGNGDSFEWIQWLESKGVDAAKINIGVSKSCRTKEYTGFGTTTITDLKNCADHANKIKIISDGGLTTDGEEVMIGDIAKSLVFGADVVMSGTLFKNCIDSPAIINGYYGNASRKAKGNEHVEGTIISNLKTNGMTVCEMMKLIEQSLKSSVSYAGGNSLNDLKKCKYQIIFN